MLDKVITELGDLGWSVHYTFEKSTDYILLEIKNDGKVYQRTISYAGIFYTPGVPSLEGTLIRYLKDALYCIRNDLKLSEKWTLVEE